MRIQNQNSNLINSLYSQSVKRNGMSAASGGFKSSAQSSGNDLYSGWSTGTANLDINSKTSVRKQMQDQLRNLFEKERAKTSPLFSEDKDPVNGADKEEDKEDKLLNSGKIYNFKEVSNKIMRAKTSVSAGQALVAAKRKISEIKRKLASSDGDSDELQMALTHARKMEVVAERKKNNLQLEELVKNTQKRDELLKKMEDSSSMKAGEYEAVKDEILDRQLEHIDEQSEIMKEEAAKMQEEMSQKIEENEEEMMEQMSNFIDEMSDEESEMLRKMSEMVDAMEAVDPHMSKETLDKLKLKHRLSEQKALMKADMDYLKDVFKHLDGRSAAGMSGMNGGVSLSSMTSVGMASVAFSGAVSVSADTGGDAPSPSVDVSV
ncbi:MAG: hypothetical protein IKP31_02205 [Lachnospiraceae bacterium]|nr:hypothetical protein [Lachnospiraceae bacterium]